MMFTGNIGFMKGYGDFTKTDIWWSISLLSYLQQLDAKIKINNNSKDMLSKHLNQPLYIQY